MLQSGTQVRWMLPLLLLALPACGGDEPPEAEDPEAVVAEAPAPAAAPPAQQGPLVVTVADLDAYERGRTEEVAVLTRLKEELKTARTGEDTLRIMAAGQEMETAEAGARAAGVPVERYRQVTGAVEQSLSAGTGQQMMDQLQQQMAGVDTTQMPPQMREQMRQRMAEMEQDRARVQARQYENVSPDAVPLLQQRAPQLDTLRMKVVGARLALVQ